MPLELELQEGVSHPVWVLRPKLQSSGAAINTLNSRGISLTPRNAYSQGKEIYGFTDCLFLTRSYVSPIGHCLHYSAPEDEVYGLVCARQALYQLSCVPNSDLFFLIHK